MRSGPRWDPGLDTDVQSEFGGSAGAGWQAPGSWPSLDCSLRPCECCVNPGCSAPRVALLTVWEALDTAQVLGPCTHPGDAGGAPGPARPGHLGSDPGRSLCLFQRVRPGSSVSGSAGSRRGDSSERAWGWAPGTEGQGRSLHPRPLPGTVSWSPTWVRGPRTWGCGVAGGPSRAVCTIRTCMGRRWGSRGQNRPAAGQQARDWSPRSWSRQVPGLSPGLALWCCSCPGLVAVLGRAPAAPCQLPAPRLGRSPGRAQMWGRKALVAGWGLRESPPAWMPLDFYSFI